MIDSRPSHGSSFAATCLVYQVDTSPVAKLARRTFKASPSVLVSETTNPGVSALLADEHCGDDVDLIYYLTPGTLLLRPFTAKDTHSPRGELLVVYSEGRGADHATLASAEATRALLGFDAPIFTYGTDLILPSFVNAQLRELIASESEFDPDMTVLEVLAEFDSIDAAEVCSHIRLVYVPFSIIDESLHFFA